MFNVHHKYIEMEILVGVVVGGLIIWAIIVAVKKANKAHPISTKKGGGGGSNENGGPKETGA